MGRERTKFQGVYQRQHSTRRHLGKPDICYDITYKTPTGKKLWEKVGWISEGYSAQAAAQVRAERVRGMRHGDMPSVARMRTPTFAEGFERYKKDWLCQIKTADEDVRRYHAYLEKTLAAHRLNAITPLDVERLKNDMTAKGYSPQTVKHALGLVRRVYRKLAAWGVYTGKSPTDNVPMPRVDSARVRYLTPDEAERLLSAIKLRSGKWHDIVLLSLHSGMRLGEILAMRWEDMHLNDGHCYVRDGKGGSRTVLLTQEAVIMLRERGPKPTGLIFPARGSADTISAAVLPDN